MASVFIQQRSTIIKAGIHHKRSRDRNFPSGFILNKPAWGCSQKFRLQFSSPLSAIAVLIFLVQKVPFFLNPPVCIGRWTWQVEWKNCFCNIPAGEPRWYLIGRPAAPDLSPPCCLTSLPHFKEHKNLGQLQVNYRQSVNPWAQIISQTTSGNDNQCSRLSAGAASNY